MPPQAHLGDRPLHITAIRCWEALSLREKVFALFIGGLVHLILDKDKDSLEEFLIAREEMAKAKAKAKEQIKMIEARAKAMAMAKARHAPPAPHPPQQPSFITQKAIVSTTVEEKIALVRRKSPALWKAFIYERDCCMVRHAANCAPAPPEVAAAWLLATDGALAWVRLLSAMVAPAGAPPALAVRVGAGVQGGGCCW